MKNELEDSSIHSDSMAHYDACYGDNDMNACRGALIYFNSITKTYQSGSLRKAVYND
jgi:hypothetical protein